LRGKYVAREGGCAAHQDGSIDTYPAFKLRCNILHMPTRLEQYLKSRGIKPAHLARESGYSRQHLLRIRMGRMEPTRRCIAAIVMACRRLSHEPVRATDLFDLEGEEQR